MRQTGVLMHITSLPSPGGIGDLGPDAYAFADFLNRAGVRVWQVLPIGPTGFGESPYQSPSAFAGNPLLISPVLLRREGILSCEDSELFVPADAETVDFDAVRENRTMLLRRAFRQSGDRLAPELKAFRRDHPWAEDYALFSALKDHFGPTVWTGWPDRGIRKRRPWSLRKYRAMLDPEVRFHLFCQYLFRRQWADLRKYCSGMGISLFGDMPIYVAEDSADTWTNPKVFQLDRNRVPIRVAGVPPDYFSEDGQLWGNPLYRWNYLKRKKYAWWVDRMRGAAELFDVVRVDHFIGFAHYYSIPYGAPNARNGKWVDGPGYPLFERLQKAVPDLKIVAEDLGSVNDQVLELLARTGCPGMKVLSFGFDGDETNPHFPANYTANSVVYTGTHDNDTVLGWAEKASPKALDFAMRTLGFSDAAEAPDAFVRCVLESPADTAVIPMQDLLGLGGDARMNLPGTVGGNWRWRLHPGAASPELADRLRAMNEAAGRI